MTAALAGALASTAVLAAGYAAYTYLHGNAAGGQSATATAVNIAVNSQPAYGGATILDTLGAPVVWLGVLGLAALAAGLVRLRLPGQVMAAVTLLLWCVVMYLGSRFAFDGFPVRFETDLGGPLAVVGAFGLVVVLRSLAGLARWRPACRALAAVLSVVAAGTLLSTAGLQVTEDAQADIAPVPGGILIEQVADAGAFLRRHNTGGTIITTPGMNAGITNRAVLAMGGYTGLQSYSAYRTEHPRSLPTAGLVPLLDSREVLHNPLSCRTATIITRQHVKFIVMYRPGHIDELLNFRQDPSRYRQVSGTRTWSSSPRLSTCRRAPGHRPPARNGPPAILRKGGFPVLPGRARSLLFDHGICWLGAREHSWDRHKHRYGHGQRAAAGAGLGGAHLGRADGLLPRPDRAAQPGAPGGDRGQPGRGRGGRRQRLGPGRGR